ncbi:unnamed protein product [Nesidiocoris tenuis]|uniref:Uncharacterized protein n=1 Tax=Nesidiocoris tenuis TaxID=355587 RepID=A0A6H5HM53_9HEMI|nr:unnamed protein product [Nesidiocoris tenuis]
MKKLTTYANFKIRPKLKYAMVSEYPHILQGALRADARSGERSRSTSRSKSTSSSNSTLRSNSTSRSKSFSRSNSTSRSKLTASSKSFSRSKSSLPSSGAERGKPRRATMVCESGTLRCALSAVRTGVRKPLQGEPPELPAARIDSSDLGGTSKKHFIDKIYSLHTFSNADDVKMKTSDGLTQMYFSTQRLIRIFRRCAGGEFFDALPWTILLTNDVIETKHAINARRVPLNFRFGVPDRTRRLEENKQRRRRVAVGVRKRPRIQESRVGLKRHVRAQANGQRRRGSQALAEQLGN